VKDQLVGVTTLAGVEIKFDDNGYIQGDTVRATVRKVPFMMPADSVQRWWLRQANTAGTVGLVVLTVGVVVLIVAAATYDPEPTSYGGESCPFVYSWNGSEYAFDAEPFGGAITRGLERDDYSVLPSLRSDGGRFRLLMINQMAETRWRIWLSSGRLPVPRRRGAPG
jgi:hypothetical protein